MGLASRWESTKTWISSRLLYEMLSCEVPDELCSVVEVVVWWWCVVNVFGHDGSCVVVCGEVSYFFGDYIVDDVGGDKWLVYICCFLL